MLEFVWLDSSPSGAPSESGYVLRVYPSTQSRLRHPSMLRSVRLMRGSMKSISSRPRIGKSLGVRLDVRRHQSSPVTLHGVLESVQMWQRERFGLMRPFLRPDEVAEFLRCSKTAVYDAISRGDLRAHRAPRLVVDVRDLAAFVAAAALA